MGLAVVELLMAVEDEFTVEFGETDAAHLETVEGLLREVLQQLRARGDETAEPLIWSRLRELICQHLGVKAERVQLVRSLCVI